MRVCTGLIWLRYGPVAGSYKYGNQLSEFPKMMANFFSKWTTGGFSSRTRLPGVHYGSVTDEFKWNGLQSTRSWANRGTTVRTAGVLIEIRTQNLPNTRLERYCCTNKQTVIFWFWNHLGLVWMMVINVSKILSASFFRIDVNHTWKTAESIFLWNFCNSLSDYTVSYSAKPQSKEIKNKKINPVTGRGSLQDCEMLRITHCLGNRLTDGGEVVSPTHRPHITPQEHYFSASGTHFC
jgi:hypothetical protein